MPRRAQEVVAYQSFYDSLNPADSPSRALVGGTTLGGLIPSIEHAFLLDELSRGRTVVVADTEGERADLIAAPEYGKHTLNGLRAALSSPLTGLGSGARIALLGYSGGALATEWAAELAPSYAPDIDARLVGAAMGGVLVEPLHNLQYTAGSAVWSVVLGLAIVGLDRSFDVDVRPALNAYGRRVFRDLEHASIAGAIGRFPNLTWRQIARPEYPTIESVPGFLAAAHALRMGRAARPSAPLFIAQGTRGELEGTRGDRPGIGAGDGIAIAGDVRTLARGYCARGLSITYRQYAASHVGAMVPWMPAASRWIGQRFRGTTVPDDCARIPAGNDLDPSPSN